MADPAETSDGNDAERRPYDSPVRRRRAAETRERILTAASELVHGFPSYEWSALTFRAVAEKAGVGERTVYRHFPSEHELHDAVMGRLEEEAGVTYEGLAFDDIAATTAAVFLSSQSFSAEQQDFDDLPFPFGSVERRRRRAIATAVGSETGEWSSDEHLMAAGALDILWDLRSYERLVTLWGMDPQMAADTVGWAIELVQEAIREGRRPPVPGDD